MIRGICALFCGFGLLPLVCQAANPGLLFTSAVAIGTIGEIDGIAVDARGNTYLAGWARTAGLKTTPGVVQPQYPGGAVDIFVVKLDSSGNVLFATYWGGPGDDEGLSVAADEAGNVYVAGISRSKGTSTYPTTSGAAFRSGSPGGQDGFVLKLNPTGTSVIYSTLVPGAGVLSAAIAVDAAGDAYFSGTTPGTDNSIAATPGAFQSSHGGSANPVVVKFGPTGSVVYATFLGGSGNNDAGGIAVDSSGDAYICGDSDSPDFPVTPGAFALAPHGTASAFVLKLNAAGSGLIYSSFLGPGNAGRIHLDAQGNAYILGISAAGFPATAGAFQSSLSSPWNWVAILQLTFIAKMNPTGTALIYSSLFAGAGGLAIDAAGRAYVAGVAAPGLPVTAGAFQRCVYGPSTAMFAAQLDPEGRLAAASYIGGNGYDYPTGIAVESDGAVHIAASVNSLDFPGLPGAGGPDSTLAVSKLAIATPGAPDLPCLTEAIQNGASFESQPIAPGELVTLRGVGLGPSVGEAAQLSAAGGVSPALADAQVFFNGIPAPLLYAQSGQVNAQVPWELAGASAAQVRVSYQGSYSNTATVAVKTTAPALFHFAPFDGTGAAPFPGAILNEDGSVNSAANPAARGSVVTLFGTGGGPTSPAGVTGGAAPTESAGLLNRADSFGHRPIPGGHSLCGYGAYPDFRRFSIERSGANAG